ncbi:hypothetical protein L9F63_004633 [Diploptera punctata]|uniref:CBF1-interacting co-repressor CIR N-terminal domain-containing protein n=1 Tax=Diploptera punctata TaxID=6984 RepID=A0AAD7ZGI2_DIPPU|nr:hypothetical protein L9F63_004633 [Diploptera punctata]
MGGGDLNLKKSWHPSTMRNMEKVWKAEQKHDQEKKRIAELQREIREERAREDIQKYAEEKGVIEKKDNMKLDWMYKGPGGTVDREEYLLGRAIDKSFEQMQQAEKASSSKNTVELDCLPTSIFSGGDEQVDMARKLQEDPLYLIKKKEIESRSQILKNPVKLKQLQELVEQRKFFKNSPYKFHGSTEDGDNRRHICDSHETGKDLDALLAAKYIKLKEKLHKTDIAKLKRKRSDSSDSESSDNNRNNKIDMKHKRKHTSDSSEDEKPHRGYGLQKTSNSKDHLSKKRSSSENQQRTSFQRKSPPNHRYAPKQPWVKPERKKLTEEELEQKRREMMDNAKWREKEREKNVARYKAQDENERKKNKGYDENFLRKQLSSVAAQGTIESRIKSNLNNIQRSGRDMDKHFARR